jgi:hypothetical protein
LQMTSHNVWTMSLYEHFFKSLSLYLVARIWIRIQIQSNKNQDSHQIKIRIQIRIQIGIKVMSRIRIRIKVIRIHNTGVWYTGSLCPLFILLSRGRPTHMFPGDFFVQKAIPQKEVRQASAKTLTGRRVKIYKSYVSAVCSNWVRDVIHIIHRHIVS